MARARKSRQPGCLGSLVGAVGAVVFLPFRAVGAVFQSLKPGPHLRSPEQAAVFVLENLSGLTFAQIGDIEKNVKAFLRSTKRREDITASVIYGCRILKPALAMVSVDKISKRWADAWCGATPSAPLGVLLAGDAKWTSLCARHWTPLVVAAVERALKGDAASVAKALDAFYPEIHR